ncbi:MULTISPECIES: hypothetical protein [Streptosporangium]|uniref:Uncharacterized protein n=1 Tax=Streptosporangium brasiliense TaxID=47480 RepID=A0ABT9QXM1_9ACTN|nr:hypothetical protein [Streptosporangium brasiliense]MDP9861662.1 hypothetical protein [Streptosporangium brasiliense]
MSDIDDIDRRFAALTAQISQEERRRMSRAARRGQARPPRSRRRRRRIAAFTVVAVVAGAGVYVAYRPEVVDRIRTALTGQAPGVAGARDPGAAPEETAPAAVEPAQISPFYGSPAEKYADGVEGLVMPPARAMGGLSAKEVSAALKRTVKLLKASNLDRGVLAGGRPTELIGLLDPEQRKRFVKELDRPGKDGSNSRWWVTSLAPGTAELAVETVKVDGDARLSAFRRDGRPGIRVKVNHLFVYAVRRPGRPDSTMRLVKHSMGTLEAWKDGGRLRFWLTRWNSGMVSPARCDIDDGFVRPLYPDSGPGGEAEKATGPLQDPYSREDDPEHEDCVRVSRT